MTHEVLDAIRRLAEAAHAKLYEFGASPVPGLSPTLGMPASELARFDSIAASDPVLGQIYEAGDDGIFVTADVGSGWRLQPSRLGTNVLESAAIRELYRGANPQQAIHLADEAEVVLRSLVELLAGESTEVPALSGFRGISLDGNEVEVPWGTLRDASPFAAALTPYGDGATASAVIESPINITLAIGEPDSVTAPFDPSLLEPIRRATTLLPLATLLGIERPSYVAVQSLWQTILLPGTAGLSHSRPRTGPGWGDRFSWSISLDIDEQARLKDWAERVETNHHPSVDIAIRRALSAVRERGDHEDALIDAVIAMESLFGHGGETEVGFRVSSAIAILLEDDPAGRKAFRSRLGKVYSSRSQVVHGGAPKPETVHAHKEEAISVATRCLRTLFADHPHLIADKDRGMRLILRDE
jgi:hypothetical protein